MRAKTSFLPQCFVLYSGCIQRGCVFVSLCRGGNAGLMFEFCMGFWWQLSVLEYTADAEVWVSSSASLVQSQPTTPRSNTLNLTLYKGYPYSFRVSVLATMKAFSVCLAQAHPGMGRDNEFVLLKRAGLTFSWCRFTTDCLHTTHNPFYFVRYNGHPEFAHMSEEFRAALASSDTVAIVGVGNVALDCARILAKGKERQVPCAVYRTLSP